MGAKETPAGKTAAAAASKKAAEDAEVDTARNEVLERVLEELKKKDELLKSELKKKDDNMLLELQKRDEVLKQQQEELDRLRREERGGSRSRSKSRKSCNRRSKSRSRSGSRNRSWKSSERIVKRLSKLEVENMALEEMKAELSKMKRNMEEKKLVFKKKGNKLLEYFRTISMYNI